MTSVNNNENNAKFYQFLQQNGGINAADSSGDGVVTKTEFRKFLEANDFDFKSLDGWNGEKATKSENDLINNFWKTINTNTSTSKIKGTKVRNSAALDANEQQTVMNKIIASEELDAFMETVEIPSFVSGQDTVKQEIKENLMSLIEKNILKPTAKELDRSVLTEFLETNFSKIKNQAVAEQYASECMAENLGDAAKEYNYKYGDDATLKNMINKLFKNLSEETEESEIQEAIENLVKGYLATAGLGDADDIPVGRRAANAEDGTLEDVDPVSADAVWYAPSNNSNLNDLQKAVLETTLKKTFDAVVKSYGSDYEAYPELFDKAVADFITETVKNAKNGTFEAVKAYGKTEFEASEAGKKCLKTVEVKNIISSEELFNKISTELTGSLGVYIAENRAYLTAMTKIENEIIEKAINGDFGEPIDKGQVLEAMVKEIKAHVTEFYENGLGDTDLDSLNKTYETMREAAVAESDGDKSLKAQREAAIKYCDALAGRNTKFKEVVETVFGQDYKATINKLMPRGNGGIDEKIKVLQEKIKELGDASTFKLDASSWGSLTTKSIYDLETVRKSAQQFLTDNNVLAKLNSAQAGYGGVYAYSAKIYRSQADIAINTINTSQDVNAIIKAVADLRSNTLIAGQLPDWNAPRTDAEVSAITILTGEEKTFNIAPKFKDENGNDIAPTSDRISYETSNDLISVATDGTVTVKGRANKGNFDTTIQILVDGVVIGERTIRVSVKEKIDLSTINAGFEGATIADHLSNGQTALQLSGFAHWDNAKTNAKNAISGYLDRLVTVLQEQGYEASRLQKAAQSVKNYYNAVIDTIYDNCYGSGSNRNTNINVNYIDAEGTPRSETTWYNQNTHEYERDAGRTDEGARNIAHDSCGIRMNESYSGTNTYEYYINTAVLLKKFQSFLDIV